MRYNRIVITNTRKVKVMNKQEIRDLYKSNDPKVKAESHLRDMVCSIWCYGGGLNEGDYSYEKYIAIFYNGEGWRKPYHTKEEVQAIVADQRDYLNAHCTIEHDVETDSEGVTYNSIIWD